MKNSKGLSSPVVPKMLQLLVLDVSVINVQYEVHAKYVTAMYINIKPADVEIR